MTQLPPSYWIAQCRAELDKVAKRSRNQPTDLAQARAELAAARTRTTDDTDRTEETK